MVTRRSNILGPDGRAVEVAVLAEEVAEPTLSGVRRTIEDRQATGLTPERLAQILREAETGHGRAYLTLALEMEERYLHYASQVQTRRLAIEGVDPIITVPKGVPAKIADAVNEITLDDSAFRSACGDITSAISQGYGVVEPIWEYEQRHLRPVDYKWRDPRFFVFDRRTLSTLRLATDADPFEGEELPAYKFITHMPRTRVGIPLRAGMARPAAWAFLIQSFALKDWSAFAEIYGIPFRLGRYGANATDADKRALLRAVKMMANDGAAIAPTGMEVEFVKVEGSHGAAVFGELIDYVDSQISKLVLGQTMTTDNGSSMAQAVIHNEVRLDILRADGRQLADTLNRDLIKPFVAFNFGPQEVYPAIEYPVLNPEDIEALSQALGTLVPLGLRVGQRAIRDKLGLAEPESNEELLAAPKPEPKPEPALPQKEPAAKEPTAKLGAGAHGTGCACAACRSASGGSLVSASASEDETPDEIDRLVDAATEAQWEDITDPLLTPLRAILAKATTLEEAAAMLANARPDGTALATALTSLTLIARGLGDAGDALPEPVPKPKPVPSSKSNNGRDS